MWNLRALFGHYDQPPEAYRLTEVAPGLYVTNFVRHSDEKIKEIAEREWFKPSPLFAKTMIKKQRRSEGGEDLIDKQVSPR